MKRAAFIVFLIIVAGLFARVTLHTAPLLLGERFSQALQDLDSGRVDEKKLTEVSNTIQAFRVAAKPDSIQAAEVLDAVILLRGDRFESALRRLSKLDQNGSLRSHILLYAGESLYRLQRYSEAARALAVVVTEEPDNLPAHRWLSATYYDLGAYNAAIIELNHVIRLDPSDFRPHRLLGIMYEDFEQHGEAVTHFTKALSLTTDRSIQQSMLLDLSRARIALNQFDEAIVHLEKVEICGMSCVLKARCLLNLGPLMDAEAQIQLAADLNEQTAERYLIEAELYEALGQSDRALSALKTAAEKFPFDAEVRYRLALGLKKNGSSEEAEQQMAVWQANKDLSARLTELNLQAIEDPDDAAVRQQLALVCEKLGKKELAMMWRAAAESCKSASLLPEPK